MDLDQGPRFTLSESPSPSTVDLNTVPKHYSHLLKSVMFVMSYLIDSSDIESDCTFGLTKEKSGKRH